MTDVFSPSKRKEVMSAIRSKNSKAELLVFQYLHKNEIYYQKHYNRALGKPDIALPRKKLAVFIDGDFWHGKNMERRLRGRANDDYWVKKIQANVTRDKNQRFNLESSGWRLLAVWESDILRKRTREQTLIKIKKFITIE